MSGWITTGFKTKELERLVATFCSVNRAVSLGLKYACAEMTLYLLGIKNIDEAITTFYTYTASASVVCYVGAKLILVDKQDDSLEMNYEKLADDITEKTKHFIPCDYNKIFEVVESKKHLFYTRE